MQGSGRALGIKLAIATNRLRCAKDLDRDAARSELLQRVRIGVHAPVHPGPDQQALGQLWQHLGQVLDHEFMAVAPPPVRHGAIGQQDQVRLFLVPVDHDPPNE